MHRQGFRPATKSQVQEKLEKQTAALEEDIRQMCALLAANCKRHQRLLAPPRPGHLPAVEGRDRGHRG